MTLLGSAAAASAFAGTAGAPPGPASDPKCYSAVVNEWICKDYFVDRQDELIAATREHLAITIFAVLLGLVLAIPLALLARRSARVEGAVLGFCTGVYTIPSLALFPLIVPFTGLSRTTVVIGLALYSLTILVRNTVEGLRGVPDDVIESADRAGLLAAPACCCGSSCRWRCR